LILILLLIGCELKATTIKNLDNDLAKKVIIMIPAAEVIELQKKLDCVGDDDYTIYYAYSSL
jgi:hypothetical protein